MIRELYTTQYDSRGYTDENTLAKLYLTKPDSINKKLTYLWGKDKNKFSFLFMTEGQGLTKEVNDVQYTWDIMGKMRYTVELVNYPGGATYPGLGNTPVQMVFKDNWGIRDYGLLAPDGQTQVQIMAEPTPYSSGGYLYTLQLRSGSPTDYIPLANLQNGVSWVLLAPAVPESGSRGNRSNVMGTGKLTNQTSFKRYSKKIEGNLANKVTIIEFSGDDTKDGKATNLWINEEMRQFDIGIRELNNQDLYLSEYNRETNGTINLKYWDNGKPIPIGAGVREIITETGNYDTYGTDLTIQKLKNTIGDVFWGNTDTGTMEIILHCGRGFAEDFDAAIVNDVTSKPFLYGIGDQFVKSGKDGYLSYGNYFTQYKDISGHIITLKIDNMFDEGLLADLDKANGNLHPRTGYPMSSHTGVFVDYSTYNGGRNVYLVSMKGQSNIAGVVKGLSPIPASWGAVPVNTLAHDKDESSYEIKQSRSINIDNPTHCFILQSVI